MDIKICPVCQYKFLREKDLINCNHYSEKILIHSKQLKSERNKRYNEKHKEVLKEKRNKKNHSV